MNDRILSSLVAPIAEVFIAFEDIFYSKTSLAEAKTKQANSTTHGTIRKERDQFMHLYNAICKISYPNKNMRITPHQIVYLDKRCDSYSAVRPSLIVNFAVINKDCIERIGSEVEQFKFCPAISSPVGEMFILIPDSFNLSNIDTDTDEGIYNLNCLTSILSRLALLSVSYITRIYSTLAIFPSVRSDIIALAIVVPYILEALNIANVELSANEIFALLPAFTDDDIADQKIRIIDRIKSAYGIAYKNEHSTFYKKNTDTEIASRILDEDLIYLMDFLIPREDIDVKNDETVSEGVVEEEAKK